MCTRILYEALLDYAYRYLIKANENWRGLGLGQILCLRIVWGYAETFLGYLFLPGYDYSYDINIVMILKKIGGDLLILIDNRWPTRNRRVM